MELQGSEDEENEEKQILSELIRFKHEGLRWLIVIKA